MINKILKIIGKENFKIDKNVPKIYIIRICWKYSLMKIRGILKSIGYKNISNQCFIGKKVKLICKRNIEIGTKTKIHDNVKIDALSTQGVKIGANSVIGENNIIEVTGTIKNIGKGLTIGNNTSFGRNCYFRMCRRSKNRK